MDDQVSLFKLCYGGVPSYWEVKAEDLEEAINYINEENTRASDEVIRGLVEALEEARVSLGEKYGFDKAPVKVQIQFRNIGKALAQARKHLQSEK